MFFRSTSSADTLRRRLSWCLSLLLLVLPLLSSAGSLWMPMQAAMDDQQQAQMPCHQSVQVEQSADQACPHCDDGNGQLACECCDNAATVAVIALLPQPDSMLYTLSTLLHLPDPSHYDTPSTGLFRPPRPA